MINNLQNEIFKEPIFSEIDKEFSLFVSRIDSNFETILAALLVSSTTMAGNVCLYLPSFAGQELRAIMVETDCDIILPEFEEWIDVLRKSKAVGNPHDFAPMILDNSGRLYLQRYWYYEDMLARSIKDKTKTKFYERYNRYDKIACLIDSLFPNADINSVESHLDNNEDDFCKKTLQPDWQKAAAAASILNNFTVISGGPGTGKTTTIAKILIALSILESKIGNKLSAAITAPTGKAAARLMESINLAIEKAAIDESTRSMLKEIIPTEPHTIHRLLGYKHGSPFFKHNRDNPLSYDIVVVDESSMADLPLMSKLFDALSLESRIILLGDNNQLSSVESGAVLGDICSGTDGSASSDQFSKEFVEKIKTMGSGFQTISGSSTVPAIADSIVILKKSFRFDEKSGIGALSSLVNSGESDEAVELLLGCRYKAENNQERKYKDLKYKDIKFIELKGLGLKEPSNCLININSKNIHALHELIESIAVDEYKKALKADTPKEAFELLTQFRILTPIRKGEGGLEDINRYIDISLNGKYGGFYNGLPIIVKRNDYGLSLYNGDIGIFLNDKDGLRVFFQGQNGFRRFMPGRLPEYETAYTLTVHKSQGSEFDKVLLVIPESRSPVLTREMLYTGITRAKKELIIAASTESISRMIENPIKRYSGLTENLWK